MPEPQSKDLIDSTAALARKLGLSRWTVSRALNGHPEVNPETARRILQASREAGFTPNPMAMGLRQGRTATIGVCFQELETPALTKKLAVLQKLLHSNGFRPLIELANLDTHREAEAIRNFLAMRVSGILLVNSRELADGEGLQLLLRRGQPTVLVDPVATVALPTVRLDRSKAAAAVIDLLVDMGHRHFALGSHLTPDNPRWQGLQTAMQKHGLAPSDHLWHPPGSDEILHPVEHGRHIAMQWIKSDRTATALIFFDDRTAMAAMRELRLHCVAVPGEVSVVGFDNMEAAAYLNPSLTTVDHRAEELMRVAWELLARQLGEEAPSWKRPPRRVVAPRLIPRESTGPCIVTTFRSTSYTSR